MTFNAFGDEPTRPSRLQLDRFATGELKGPERAAVQQWLETNPSGFAHLEEIKHSKKRLQPLDIGAVRARAGVENRSRPGVMDSVPTLPESAFDSVTPEEIVIPHAQEPVHDLPSLTRRVIESTAAEAESIVDDPSSFAPDEVDHTTVPFAEEREMAPGQSNAAEIEDAEEEPALAVRKPHPNQGRPAANRPFPKWVLAAVPLVAAAVASVVVLSQSKPNPALQFRGGGDLALHQLVGGKLSDWHGEKLGEGDVVGFSVATPGHTSVVVVSVDDAGTTSVWYPAPGQPNYLPTEGAARVQLDGSVTLDNTKGHEVFVAVFDTNVDTALDSVAGAWSKGGTTGVAQWADKAADADAVVVEKK